eukprot:scaffold15829_cov150-Isochrysis_galbana.AAC.1
MRAKATRSTAVSVPEWARTTRRMLIIPRDRAAAEFVPRSPNQSATPGLRPSPTPPGSTACPPPPSSRGGPLDLPQLGLVAGGVFIRAGPVEQT